MILRQTLNKEIYGWWDGGAKSVFNWEIDPWRTRNCPEGYAVVGSWEGNHWFTVKAGKTEKATLGKARRRLQAQIDKNTQGLTCTFIYVEEKR